MLVIRKVWLLLHRCYFYEATTTAQPTGEAGGRAASGLVVAAPAPRDIEASGRGHGGGGGLVVVPITQERVGANC